MSLRPVRPVSPAGPPRTKRPVGLIKTLKSLLRPNDFATGIMTTEYIELLDTLLVDDAIEKIRNQGKDAETIYTIFVRDAQRNFVGTVDLDDLIFAKKNQSLHDIMSATPDE